MGAVCEVRMSWSCISSVLLVCVLVNISERLCFYQAEMGAFNFRA